VLGLISPQSTETTPPSSVASNFSDGEIGDIRYNDISDEEDFVQPPLASLQERLGFKDNRDGYLELRVSSLSNCL